MHVAVLFVNIGGYHVARLKAAQEACVRRQWQLTAIQVTDDQLDHPWGPVGETESFSLATLFPRGQALESTRERTFSSAAGQALRNLLDRVRPDVLFVPGWSLPVARTGIEWCLRNGAAPVVMSESKEDDAPRSWWRERFKRWILNQCCAGLAGGSPHRDYLLKLGMPAERIFLGYDVVDNDYFSRRADAVRSQAARYRAQLGLPEQFFLASSRFIERKNLSRLIEAYAAYRRAANGAAWNLVVLGDGELRDALEVQRNSLGLQDSVSFPGFRGYEQIPAYYGLASVFIHASTVEQWGLVVNEAMAAGLPVVVSRSCGCAPDLVSEGRNGFTFDPMDARALGDCLKRISEDPEQLGSMGRMSQQIVSQWGPARFAEGFAGAVAVAMAPTQPRRALERLLLTATARL